MVNGAPVGQSMNAVGNEPAMSMITNAISPNPSGFFTPRAIDTAMAVYRNHAGAGASIAEVGTAPRLHIQ